MNSKSYHQKLWYIAFGYIAEWKVIISLLVRGYKLLAHRYKNRYGEIDIIMQHDDTIVFIEVKGRKNMRNTIAMGEVVSHKQKQRIQRSAQYFLSSTKRHNTAIRFDIVIITSLWRTIKHFRSAW